MATKRKSAARKFLDKLSNERLTFGSMLKNIRECDELSLADLAGKLKVSRQHLHAIETGYIQREIQNSAYQYQRAVETKDAIVVGVNQFASEDESKIKTLRVDASIEQDQVERVRALRQRRDASTTDAALQRLAEAARGTENVLPRVLDCVEAFATVGEISNCLRAVWGEYRESVTV